MKYTISILFTFFVFQFAFSQIQIYDPPFQTEYIIITPSGLKLREEPNTNSRVLGLIPYGEKIRVNLSRRPISPEIIEGKKGDWKEVLWAGKQGYVFDAFIQLWGHSSPFWLNSSEMNTMNEWHSAYFPKGKTYFGLFPTQYRNNYELRNIPMKPSDEPQFLFPVDPNEIPIWFGTGLKLEEPRKIEGYEINRIIYPGESISVDPGAIYSSGDLLKKDSIRLSGYEIKDYELRYQQVFQGKFTDQLLLKMNFHRGDGGRYGYEGRAVVNFIGDIDSDEKDDIILTYQTTYKGWTYVFFSTKYAEGDRAFKAFFVGEGNE